MRHAEFLAAASVAAVAVLAVATLRGHKPAGADGARTPLYYRDPMHPSYTSPKPGIAPDCGMALEPVYANTPGSAEAALSLSPRQEEMIGLRLGAVEKSPVTLLLHVPGRVAVDETRVFPLISGADGWVTRVFPSATGSVVRKGQPLIAVYGHEYMSAQRSYAYALRSVETAQGRPADPPNDPAILLQEALATLQNMGLDRNAIQRLAETRKPVLDFVLSAPAAGVIAARNVFPNQRFDRGAEFFRIADLSSVWVVADLFGDQAGLVQPGSLARVSIPNAPGRVFQAKVATSLSQAAAAGNALQVRLEVANHDLALRPDMFADVEFSVRVPPAVTAPAEAVLDSGLRKIVFVEKKKGVYEPRAVETGRRLGDRIEITHGVHPGELVVESGAFLLDSETRLREAAGPRRN